MISRLILLFVGGMLLLACENRALHDSEEFKPREIHENMRFNFDEITVDGIEYLILEKDNNNPHEGFGFMAFRANKLMEKQDSVLAYLQTVSEMQVLILSRLSRLPEDDVRKLRDEIYANFLDLEKEELELLEENNYSGQTVVSDSLRNLNQ